MSNFALCIEGAGDHSGRAAPMKAKQPGTFCQKKAASSDPVSGAGAVTPFGADDARGGFARDPGHGRVVQHRRREELVAHLGRAPERRGDAFRHPREPGQECVAERRG